MTTTAVPRLPGGHPNHNAMYYLTRVGVPATVVAAGVTSVVLAAGEHGTAPVQVKPGGEPVPPATASPTPEASATTNPVAPSDRLAELNGECGILSVTVPDRSQTREVAGVTRFALRLEIGNGPTGLQVADPTGDPYAGPVAGRWDVGVDGAPKTLIYGNVSGVGPDGRVSTVDIWTSETSSLDETLTEFTIGGAACEAGGHTVLVDYDGVNQGFLGASMVSVPTFEGGGDSGASVPDGGSGSDENPGSGFSTEGNIDPGDLENY